MPGLSFDVLPALINVGLRHVLALFSHQFPLNLYFLPADQSEPPNAPHRQLRLL